MTAQRVSAAALRAWCGQAIGLLRLQLGGRWVLFLAADVVLLISGLFDALLGLGESAATAYLTVVIAPALLLGVPALADLVSLERDAGSLDLLLTAPHAARHLLARAAAVTGAMLLQAWLVLALTWWATDLGFALVPALFHSAAAFAVVGAAALFWTTRLESAGAAGSAIFITVLILGAWCFDVPVGPRAATGGSAFWPGAETAVSTLSNVAILVAAALLFWLAARRRLSRTALLLR